MIMSNIIKKLSDILLYPVSSMSNRILKDVHAKLAEIEYRSFNRRFFAIEQTCEYLIGAEIPGDYLEFGVFEGTTFSHAYKFISPHFNNMKFIAFDSFEGLPKPEGIDAVDGYSSRFNEGQFTCTQEDFLNHIKQAGVNLNKVRVAKGWFNKTLLPEKAGDYGIEKIAVAWIDCDLYEPTVPILKFITPYLTPGAVIIFDDWRCYRNHPDFGEQRACREWLAENPQITIRELFSFGWNGIAFTVTSC